MSKDEYFARRCGPSASMLLDDAWSSPNKVILFGTSLPSKPFEHVAIIINTANKYASIFVLYIVAIPLGIKYM